MNDYFTIRDKSGFLSVEPKPDSEILSHHYAANYYQNPRGTYSTSYSKEEEIHRDSRYMLRILSAEIIFSKEGLSINSALDIGCGEGYMMKFLKSRGFKCTGLDYSAEGLARHNADLVDDLVVGDVNQSMDNLADSQNTFDLLIAGNVLEHVVDASLFLSKLNLLMHRNSVLIISVPNDDSPFQKRLKEEGFINSNYYISPPEHINYFNKDSLVSTIESHGFKVLDIFSDFPIEWFIPNRHSNYVINPEVGPSAHAARVFIETEINLHSKHQDSLNFYRALASVGHGRVLNAVCRKN